MDWNGFLYTPTLSIQMHYWKRLPTYCSAVPHTCFKDTDLDFANTINGQESLWKATGTCLIINANSTKLFFSLSFPLKTHTHTGNQSVCRMNSQAIATAVPWDLRDLGWPGIKPFLGRRQQACLSLTQPCRENRLLSFVFVWVSAKNLCSPCREKKIGMGSLWWLKGLISYKFSST